MRLLCVTCFWIVLALSLFSCRPEGEIVRENKAVFTAAEQAKIGEMLSRHITDNAADYSLYRRNKHQELYSYLDQILSAAVTTEVVENRNNFNWKVFVVRDKKMTAFTLPGGKIYLTDGFLKFIETEAQLLALLSHEMNYTDSEVAMKMLQENYSGLILGDIVFDNQVAEIGEMILTLQEEPFTKNDVAVADTYSSEILCPFNYPSDALANLLEIELGDEEFPLEWELIRPGYEGRISNIRESAVDCRESSSADNDNYQRLLVSYLD